MKRILLPVLMLALAILLVAALGACGASATPSATGAEGVNASAPMPANVIDTSYASYEGPIGVIDSATTTVNNSAQPVGATAASQITQGNPPCPGFIETTPTYLFDLKTDADLLSVYFDGNFNSTLMVITPKGEIACNDDDNLTTNVNPLIKIEKPGQGRYGVFVGRINMSQNLTGTVYATIDPNPQFRQLAP